MSIITKGAHINRALHFYNEPSIYYCIGKSTPWPDEENPPAPDPNVSQVDEIIGFKKVEMKHLVVPDEVNGTIRYRELMWRIVVPGAVFTEGCRWVFISTEISDSDLPLGSYRQVGVYSGLQVDASVLPGKYNLLPEEVVSPGVLEIIDYKGEPVNRQIDQTEKLALIMEF